MSLRSPLGTVLGLGSAKSGHEHWWQQRLTATALVPLGLWFGVSALQFGRLGYPLALSWVAELRHAIPLVLLFLTLLLHSSLGLQVVVEDYVHHGGIRVALLVALKFLHVALGVAVVYSLVVISLGAPA